MNANTALKINDAIDQAIRCGESAEAVLTQVRHALGRALEQRAADQLKLVEERTRTYRESAYDRRERELGRWHG